MSRSWGDKKAKEYGDQKGWRKRTARNHRAKQRQLLNKITKDPDTHESVTFPEYDLCEDWWYWD